MLKIWTVIVGKLDLGLKLRKPDFKQLFNAKNIWD